MPKKLEQEYIETYINSTGEKFVEDQVYENEQQPLQIICQNEWCKKTYTKTWNNFRKGSRCPVCAQIQREDKRRMPFSKVEDIINSTGDLLWSRSDEYENNRSLLTIICGKCTTIYEKSLEDFSRRDKPRRCPECSKKNANALLKMPESEIELLCKVNKLILVTQYSDMPNVKHPCTFICCNDNCGYQFITTIDSIKWKSTGCPKCKASQGERNLIYILERLKSNGAIKDWIKEYRFKDSDTISRLSFDFAVSTNDGMFLIEFDGSPHFVPTSFTAHVNSDDSFASTNKRDRLKNEYCVANHISLLRICYLDLNKVPEIVIAFLRKFYEVGYLQEFSNELYKTIF